MAELHKELLSSRLNKKAPEQKSSAYFFDEIRLSFLIYNSIIISDLPRMEGI